MQEQKTLEQVLGELEQKVRQRISDETTKQEVLAEIGRLRQDLNINSSGVEGILRAEKEFLRLVKEQDTLQGYSMAEKLAGDIEFTQQDIQDYVFNHTFNQKRMDIGFLISALINKIKPEHIELYVPKAIGWLGLFNEFSDIVIKGDVCGHLGNCMKGGKIAVNGVFLGGPNYGSIGSGMQGGEIVLHNIAENASRVGANMQGGLIRLGDVYFGYEDEGLYLERSVGYGMKGGEIRIHGSPYRVKSIGSDMKGGSIIVHGPLELREIITLIGSQMAGGKIQIQELINYDRSQICKIAQSMSGGEIEINGSLKGFSAKGCVVGGDWAKGGKVAINDLSDCHILYNGGVDLYCQGEKVEKKVSEWAIVRAFQRLGL